MNFLMCGSFFLNLFSLERSTGLKALKEDGRIASESKLIINKRVHAPRLLQIKTAMTQVIS